jgi:hypothetical protein
VISRNLTSMAIRAALSCGVSFAAIAPGAFAQSEVRHESVVYLLRYGQEIADGTQVISQSKDMMVARRRIGDQSMMVIDTQNGAITVERKGGSAVIPLVSVKGPEAALVFDYAELQATGSDFTADIFNTFVRPVANLSPGLGKDAQWSVDIGLRQLGLASAGDGKAAVELSRTYFQLEGKPAVLLEFNIPAFTYADANGDTVVHWARGLAVTDPGFGEVHVYATQHRASVREADGDMRPVSVRTSIHGVDRNGAWRASFANAPQVLAAMSRLAELQGDTAHPVANAGASQISDLPVRVAARLDAFAFGVGENSPNMISGIGGAGGDLPPGAFGAFVPFGEVGPILPPGTVLPPLTQELVDQYNASMAALAEELGQPAPRALTLQEYQEIPSRLGITPGPAPVAE